MVLHYVPSDATSVDAAYEAMIVPKPPVGLIGSVILAMVLIAVAGVLTWLFVRWANRDLETGKGPLFLYGRRK
jgi:hypothetical protein